jgi:hypothetical protein
VSIQTNYGKFPTLEEAEVALPRSQAAAWHTARHKGRLVSQCVHAGMLLGRHVYWFVWLAVSPRGKERRLITKYSSRGEKVIVRLAEEWHLHPDGPCRDWRQQGGTS